MILSLQTHCEKAGIDRTKFVTTQLDNSVSMCTAVERRFVAKHYRVARLELKLKQSQGSRKHDSQPSIAKLRVSKFQPSQREASSTHAGHLQPGPVSEKMHFVIAEGGKSQATELRWVQRLLNFKLHKLSCVLSLRCKYMWVTCKQLNKAHH